METGIYCTRCRRTIKMPIESKLIEDTVISREAYALRYKTPFNPLGRPSFIPSQDPIIAVVSHCPVCRTFQFCLLSIWEKLARDIMKDGSIKIDGILHIPKVLV